ncbi:hypothetical protein ACIQI7_09095 [Kitasatospora sp. NPDC092039]|uniref:hypothetical protein n=1 Tax=Kitasatospora sp. NPDC092039 TaxID=3364086 RepID=UPI0038113AA9
MRGLPAEALLRRDGAEIGADRWGLTQELLAQLVELVSVVAAEHRLRRPVELPRPAHLSAGREYERDVQGMARAVAVLRRSGKAASRG